MRRDRRLIGASGLFDSQWYLASYPDVEEAGLDPLSHYLATGAAEGRNPSPSFQTSRYLNHNPDVAGSKANPLVHYLRYGKAEGRVAEPVGPFSLFDARPELAPVPLYYAASKSRRVTMVTDTTSSAFLFGGVITALVLSVLLAERLDARLRLITRSHPPNLSGLPEILRLSGVKSSPEITTTWLPYGSEITSAETSDTDIYLTTSWWTTAATLESVPAEQVVYLLQDDERTFYPHGDQRLRCQETFDNPELSFLVNSRMLYDHFERQGCVNVTRRGLWFEPAFPKSLFSAAESAADKRRFVFYARPQNPRNLYLRGLEAISMAIRDGVLTPDEWEFIFVGHPDAQLLLPRDVKPILREGLSLAAYATLLGGVDVGLSLMYSPHPSYPPLDLAASGAIAVTNRYPGKTDLSGYSSNILLSDLEAEDIVRTLGRASARARDLPTRSAGYRTSGLARDWYGTTDRVLGWIQDGRYGSA
ncbi:MAG TPA: hypothetical protein VI138_02485 [Candidatus Dormibacteraeota bacterium]